MISQKRCSYSSLSGTWLRTALFIRKSQEGGLPQSQSCSVVILRQSQEFWCLWKRKLYAPLYHLLMINISLHRDPERITGCLWRCLEHYLVRCVRRHLQVEGTFSVTSRSTVGSRSTVAHSATSHLFRIFIWRRTPSFTLGRNRTSAHSATIHATSLPT